MKRLITRPVWGFLISLCVIRLYEARGLYANVTLFCEASIVSLPQHITSPICNLNALLKSKYGDTVVRQPVQPRERARSREQRACPRGEMRRR